MNLVAVLSFVALQCFNITAAFGENISKKKCDQYRNQFPQLSEVLNDNNEDAALKEFPFMARIQLFTHYMNGILISEKFVLTIASHDLGLEKKLVTLGDLEMGCSFDNAHSQSFLVIKEFIHPEYFRDLTYNLKLLMLNVTVDFDEFIRPACLPQSDSTISQKLIEIGWSETNIRNNNLLHKVKLNYISNGMCQEEFKFIVHQKQVMDRIDEQTIICATAKDGDRDMCLGFFGAALLNANRNLSSLHEVIGIAIANTGCNDTYPTVFVRISASLRWIESVVWPDEIISNVDTTTMPTTTSTTMSTTNLPSGINDPSKQKIILISVATIFTIAILSLILCIVVAYFHMNRSRSRPEVNINFRL